jgi:nicotinamide-nucleotide amidase
MERSFNPDHSDYQNVPLEMQLLANPVGIAPGLHYKNIFSLPGVPREFEAIFIESILPRLNHAKIIEKLIIKTYKVPESKIFNELAPTLWNELEAYGKVSSLPHVMGVDIGVVLEGENIQNKDMIIDLIKATKLNEYIWHIGPETLEELIIKEAKAKNLKIGFAESCTGGLNASRITDVAGSSSVFWGSIVSYSNDVKMRSLQVKKETLKTKGAVSEETAYEMAKGALEELKVDIAISTTGIAGPGGGSKDKPVGTVGIGISSKFGTQSKMYKFRGDRLLLKERFSKAALFKLLFEIRKH